MKKLIYILFTTISTSAFAQGNFLNTVSFNPEAGSPNAKIENVSWIAGHWQGEAMGGKVEELWSPPLGGSMMGSFKFIAEGSVNFYELQVISEEEGTLILRLKHFHANMKGWEEKDETVDFKLVKLESDKVFFDELTFEKVGEDELNIYVVIGEQGKEEEVRFSYKRVLK